MRGGLAWLLAGGAIGAAIAVLVLRSDAEPQYASGYDDVERGAAKTYGWGVKQRAAGKTGSVVGAVKEGFGKLTGDDDLQAEGVVERFAGNVRDKVGEVGTAVGQTIHDLNR